MNKKFIKKVEDWREYLIKVGNYYYSITIYFLSIVGFMSGIFSLALWSLQLEGKINSNIGIFILIFGVLMLMGVTLLALRLLIFIIKLFVKKK